MSIENIDMIEQHLIKARRQGRLGAVGIFVVLGFVLAALVTTL